MPHRHLLKTGLFLLFLSLIIAINNPASAQSDSYLQLTLSHNGKVEGAVWSPDGSRIATWTDDSTGHVWDSITGKQLFTFDHDAFLYGPSFSPDGKYVLSFKDDMLYIWDTVSGRKKYGIKQISAITNAIWLPTSARFLAWGTKASRSAKSASNDTFVQIWNIADGSQQTEIHVQNDYIESIKLNADGTQMAILATGENSGIRIWDTSTGNERVDLRQDGRQFLATSDIAWSSDNQKILVSGVAGDAFIADSSNGIHQTDFRNDDWILSAFRSPDTTRVAGLLITSRVVPIWDTQTGKEQMRLHSENFVTQVEWSMDSKRILTSGTDGKTGSVVEMWDAITGNKLLEFDHEGISVNTSWSGDEKYIFGFFSNPYHQDDDGDFIVWDAITGTQLLSQLHNGVIAGAFPPVWSPHDNHLLSWRGSQVFVWDLSQHT